MTVTIQGAELIQPLGQLSCDFFPDNNLNSLIGGWVTQAKRKVEGNATIKADFHNEAATLWTYYLAYSYLAGRFASMPNSVSVNAGADSVSYGQDRPAYWNGKAVAALAEYNTFPSTLVKADTPFSGPIRVVVGY